MSEIEPVSASVSRGRGRPRTFDRDKVTSAAMMMLWHQGPTTQSVNALCEGIGLSKPTLYREFSGDDGLLAAALARYQAVRIDPLLEQLRRERPMQIAVDNLVGWFRTRTELPAGCLLAKFRAVRHELGPAASRQIDAMQEAQLDALNTWMQSAHNKGELSEGLEPALAARYLDTQFTALLTLLGQGESADSVADQARLALVGIRRPS